MIFYRNLLHLGDNFLKKMFLFLNLWYTGVSFSLLNKPMALYSMLIGGNKSRQFNSSSRSI